MAFDARAFLASHAVAHEQIEEAEAGGWLPLLVVDQTLLPGQPQFSTGEVAAQAGIDPELARRLWRAMGFTEVEASRQAFYPHDVEALAFANHELVLGTSVDAVVRQTRVMNAAVSRMAEASADEIVSITRALRERNVSDDEISEWLSASVDIPRFERLFGYFFRRQLRAALWRKLAVPADRLGEQMVTVGFVDLVRFTAITEEVAEEELDALVSRFEEVSQDVISASGGRMVKMIGDEVMFVADDPAQGTGIALDLVDAYSADEHLPPARAGVACGSVLSKDGDYFGPVVNLASRIVDVARPAAVVTSEALHNVLRDDEQLTWRRLPPKRLKGIGRPWLWTVKRSRHQGTTAPLG